MTGSIRIVLFVSFGAVVIACEQMQGPAGTAGASGIDGAPGPQGAQGAPGSSGRSGVFWTDATGAIVDSAVVSSGLDYRLAAYWVDPKTNYVWWLDPRRSTVAPIPTLDLEPYFTGANCTGDWALYSLPPANMVMRGPYQTVVAEPNQNTRYVLPPNAATVTTLVSSRASGSTCTNLTTPYTVNAVLGSSFVAMPEDEDPTLPYAPPLTVKYIAAQ